MLRNAGPNGQSYRPVVVNRSGHSGNWKGNNLIFTIGRSTSSYNYPSDIVTVTSNFFIKVGHKDLLPLEMGDGTVENHCLYQFPL